MNPIFWNLCICVFLKGKFIVPSHINPDKSENIFIHRNSFKCKSTFLFVFITCALCISINLFAIRLNMKTCIDNLLTISRVKTRLIRSLKIVYISTICNSLPGGQRNFVSNFSNVNVPTMTFSSDCPVCSLW